MYIILYIISYIYIYISHITYHIVPLIRLTDIASSQTLSCPIITCEWVSASFRETMALLNVQCAKWIQASRPTHDMILQARCFKTTKFWTHRIQRVCNAMERGLKRSRSCACACYSPRFRHIAQSRDCASDLDSPLRDNLQGRMFVWWLYVILQDLHTS